MRLGVGVGVGVGGWGAWTRWTEGAAPVASLKLTTTESWRVAEDPGCKACRAGLRCIPVQRCRDSGEAPMGPGTLHPASGSQENEVPDILFPFPARAARAGWGGHQVVRLFRKFRETKNAVVNQIRCKKYCETRAVIAVN